MKKLLGLCIVLIVAIAASARAEDPIYFADPNLKAAVEAELGVTDPNSTDMLSLTELSAESMGITDLTGLEHATNLDTLYLNYNQISDISALSGLTNFLRLYLYENQITDINALSGLTDLRTLSLSSNMITNISVVSGLTKLGDLYLGNNQISDISALSGLTNLFYLALGYNQISDISALSEMTGFSVLSLNNNQIIDISPLSNLIGVTDLYLQSNQISDISALVGLTFKSLNLEDNPLNTAAYCIYLPMIGDPIGIFLRRDENTNPLTLDCDCNWVDIEQFVDEWLADDCNLANNWCYGADMDHLGQVDAADFAELARLWFMGELVYFADPSLKNAVENHLWHVTDPTRLDMLRLTNLTAINKGITNLTGLEYATNLTELTLYNNDINDISALAGLVNLTELSLWDNQISDISAVSGLTNLTHLYLGINQISDISAISGLVNLTKLDLGVNQISDISALLGLTNLTKLWLDDNQLNTAAYCIYIPMIEANNPGISVYRDNTLISDCSSDWFDLQFFVNTWLLDDCDYTNSWCGGADLDYTGQVDAVDFAEFANYWLAEP